MTFTIHKKDGTASVTLQGDELSLPGYVEYLRTEGYDVPAQFFDPEDQRDDATSDTNTVRQNPDPRDIERTPAGQPIYGSLSAAEASMTRLYHEKLAKERSVNPAAFPQDPVSDIKRPAETARANTWVPPHRREKFAENSWSANKVKKGLAIVKKKINLSAVLRDRSVQVSYGLSDFQLNLVHVLMQASPEKAAIKATECARDNGHEIVVVSDLTAASRFMARAELAKAANAVDISVRSREVPMVYLPGSTLVSMTPRKGEEDPDALHTWELTGPGKEFQSVAAVWVLIMQYGPFYVAERYGPDYAFLRIMITVIDQKTRRATTLSPGYELHSGSRFDAWSEMSRELQNSLEELKHIDFGCAPVVVANTGAVASAPAIDERWAVVPYHVVKTPGGKINGEPIEKADVQRLGDSLYAVQLKTPVLTTVGETRHPVDGEDVRLRVVGYDGSAPTKAVVSVVGQVRVVEGRTYVAGLQARPGASGSVYIAESDGKVLGLHDGQGPYGTRLLPFTRDTRSHLLSAVRWYGGGGPTLTRVLSPTVRFWSRAKHTRDAWSTLVARLGHASGVMTVLDGREIRAAVSLDDVGPGASWVRARGACGALTRVYRGQSAAESDVGPLPVRPGVPGEAVVIVCFDHEGAYISSETTLGHECLYGKENYTWSALLRDGALVVAVRDVVVVGVMSRVQHTSDWVTFRVEGPGIPVDDESSDASGNLYGPDAAKNREWLIKTFPFLHAREYSLDCIDECFTHSSCGKYQYATTVFSGYQSMARIGDAIMKARYHRVMRTIGIDPQSTTMMVAKWQNNEVQAVVATQFNLQSQIRRASRLTTIGTHGLADALEALACLVYFHEDAEILDKFLRVIAMFGEN